MHIHKTISLAIGMAAGLALSPLAANATTVTWNFDLSAIAPQPQAQHILKPDPQTFDGVFSPTSSQIVPITAYGYEEQTTTGGGNTYDSQNSYAPKPTYLYGKGTSSIGNESGLGINADPSDEIDTTVTTNFPNDNDQAATTIFQSFVQLDLTSVLKDFPNAKDATVTIGSVTGTDTAVLSYSNELGTIGTQITTVGPNGNVGVNATTINLSDFSLADPYLTISSTLPTSEVTSFTSSVLMNSFQLSYTPSTPTPEPAAAGLLGFAAMGLLLVPRRRTK